MAPQKGRAVELSPFGVDSEGDLGLVVGRKNGAVFPNAPSATG